MENKPPVLSRRLSGSDAAFLYLERKEIPLNIACVALFDGPLPFREFVANIDSKLDLIPRYRQLAVPPPFNIGYPAWEPDPRFDIRRHIFPVRLEAPGGEAQLEALAARLLSQVLDRSKPLWEIHVVDGLKDGRGALIARIHHALADGVAGAALVKIMLDPTPEGSHVVRQAGRKSSPKAAAPPAEHSLVEQLGGAIQSALENAVAAEAGLLQMADALLGDQGKSALQDLAALLPEWLQPPERFVFNKPCSGDRKFVWAEAEFSHVQAIRAALGGKVNDCILSVVVRAISRYIRLHGEKVKGRFLRVVCPVNLRGGEQGESLGNRITFLPVVVPLDVDDPVKMLHAVAARMEIMKSVRAAELVSIFASCLGATPAPMQELFWRGLPMVPLPLPLLNLICTNVPGSPTPLYSVGRRMVASYPHVPTGYELGVGVAVQSYDGKLFFGLTADAHVVPDVAHLRDFIRQCFAELAKAAGVKPVRAGKARPAARRAPPRPVRQKIVARPAEPAVNAAAAARRQSPSGEAAVEPAAPTAVNLPATVAETAAAPPPTRRSRPVQLHPPSAEATGTKPAAPAAVNVPAAAAETAAAPPPTRRSRPARHEPPSAEATGTKPAAPDTINVPAAVAETVAAPPPTRRGRPARLQPPSAEATGTKPAAPAAVDLPAAAAETVAAPPPTRRGRPARLQPPSAEATGTKPAAPAAVDLPAAAAETVAAPPPTRRGRPARLYPASAGATGTKPAAPDTINVPAAVAETVAAPPPTKRSRPARHESPSAEATGMEPAAPASIDVPAAVAETVATPPPTGRSRPGRLYPPSPGAPGMEPASPAAVDLPAAAAETVAAKSTKRSRPARLHPPSAAATVVATAVNVPAAVAETVAVTPPTKRSRPARHQPPFAETTGMEPAAPAAIDVPAAVAETVAAPPPTGRSRPARHQPPSAEATGMEPAAPAAVDLPAAVAETVAAPPPTKRSRPGRLYPPSPGAPGMEPAAPAAADVPAAVTSPTKQSSESARLHPPSADAANLEPAVPAAVDLPAAVAQTAAAASPAKPVRHQLPPADAHGTDPAPVSHTATGRARGPRRRMQQYRINIIRSKLLEKTRHDNVGIRAFRLGNAAFLKPDFTHDGIIDSRNALESGKQVGMRTVEVGHIKHTHTPFMSAPDWPSNFSCPILV